MACLEEIEAFERSLKVTRELTRQKKMRGRLVQRPSKEEELGTGVGYC